MSFLIPVIQVDNFHVYTNPLSSEKVKIEILDSGGFSLKSQLSPYTHLTSGIPFYQLKSNNPPSPPSQVNPNMARHPLYMMDRIVAVRYAPLVLLQPRDDFKESYLLKSI